MAAYGTPAYDYTKGTSDLARNKTQSDAMNDYGRFISQQRFRRNREDAGLQVKRNFPRVGGGFNRRGIYNSGLRREGQQQYLGDYNRDVQRNLQDEQMENQGFDLQRSFGDANYQAALLDLFERFQGARANVDPFANLYLPGS